MVFGKRGVERTLYDAMEIVLAVGILLLFWNNAVHAGQNPEWEKRYLAADLALTIDAAHAVPGNIIYVYIPQGIEEGVTKKDRVAWYWRLTGPGMLVDYLRDPSYRKLGIIPIEISNYFFDIADGKVTVGNVKTVMGQKQRGSATSERYIPSQLQIAASIDNPPFLTLTKVDENIQLFSDPKQLRVSQCPVVDTTDIISQKTIVIDPRDQATREIANMVKALCSNCRVLPQLSLEDKLGQLEKPDIIISLAVGTEQNDVIASIPLDSDKSSKLGCIISNRVTFVSNFRQSRTVPVNLATLKADDPKRILQKDIPSTMIHIGSPQTFASLTQTQRVEISRAIYDGLRVYFGTAVANPIRGAT